jgi:hypothetical protein
MLGLMQGFLCGLKDAGGPDEGFFMIFRMLDMMQGFLFAA